ncbi:TPA: hypothetical protein ACM6YW_004301 [Escherichia coli]|nr:hypothetical protein [Escherichia coli]HCN0045446.1 hypothetical protein [Escherichia coli]
MTVLSTKKHKQRGGGKLSHVNPEQYEIGQMSREQRKRLNENIRNYKTERQKSPAEQFEALAYSITNGDCTDFDWARAENYLKAAQTIRDEEITITLRPGEMDV